MKKTGVALMRASQMQQNIESLKKLGPETEAKVLAALPPEVIPAMQSEMKTAWLPLDLDVELTDAIQRVLGTKGVRDWARDAFSGSTSGPLLRPMLDGGLRIFGVKPARIFGLIPRGFDLLYKHSGTMRIESTSPTSLNVVHTSAPYEMTHSRPYLEGMAGAFDGLLEIMRFSGDVIVARCDPREGLVIYEVHWRAKGDAASR